MTFWQIAFGTRRPTFSEKLTLDAQWEFLRDWHRFIGTVFWRPAAMLQYVGLFLLPLLPLALMVAWKQWRAADTDPKLSRRQRWLFTICIFYITELVPPFEDTHARDLPVRRGDLFSLDPRKPESFRSKMEGGGNCRLGRS